VTLADATDSALVRRVTEADVLAFELLYDRYAAFAFSLAMRITQQRGPAEEATQDAFLSLWRSPERYDPSRGSLKTWLLAVVRNRAIDLLRRGARHARDTPIEETNAPGFAAPNRTDEEAARHMEAERLGELIAQLPATQRATIELAYFKGLSHTEIAKKLNLPLGTVKGRQRLALAKLRCRLPSPAIA
jgi:RNA polymerase sigma-70 factor (ECF subfamily)